jgi:hypothetical protein
MRRIVLLVVGILCVASVGCGSFWQNTTRNLTEAPVWGIDEYRINSRNHRLAREAWTEICQASPEHAFSPDYADGFIEGYADYLESGGTGQPPAVPPFRYRLSRYQTPEGIRAIEDWYAGFRHGASSARASGLREQFVLPLSAPPINAIENKPVAPASVAPATPNELPPPRPLIEPQRPANPEIGK